MWYESSFGEKAQSQEEAVFFFSSRRRHTRYWRDWSSDVCSNDAARADAGRLVKVNPFAGLRLKQSRGRRDVQPPKEAEAARLIALGDELTPPSFAAYLDVDVHEGVRPG